MQLRPNDTQSLLRDSVRRFVARDYRAPAHETLGHDAGTWAFFAEQGWLAAGAPESVGGLGGDLFDICLIAEELGRGLVREAFAPVAAATVALRRLAPESPLLAGLLWGSERPVLAHNEAAARGDPESVSTVARRVADGFVLEGAKSALLGAPAATSLLVSARVEGQQGLTIFAVDPATPGVQVQSYRTVDNRGAANLRLDAVRISAEDAVGEVGGAGEAITEAVAHHLLAASAEALGAMDAALMMTRDYLMTRRQFGVPISDFQALRHRLADMFIETEQARSIILRAIGAWLDGEGEAAQLTSAAKARVGKAGHFVGAQAIQLHGGIGVTEECAVGQYYKRLVMFDLLLGPGAAHLDLFTARGLGGP